MTNYEFTIRVSDEVVRRLVSGQEFPPDPNMEIHTLVLVQAGMCISEQIRDAAGMHTGDPVTILNIRGPFLSRGGERGRQQSSLLTSLQRVDALLREVADLERSQNEFVDELLKDAPRCWDGDEAAESIALDYLRSLEAATAEGNIPDQKTKHRDGCDGGC